jgi:hypothetical protein
VAVDALVSVTGSVGTPHCAKDISVTLSRSKLDRRIVPDAVYPAMYRLRLPGGGLPDMVNLARAKDTLRALDEGDR